MLLYTFTPSARSFSRASSASPWKTMPLIPATSAPSMLAAESSMNTHSYGFRENLLHSRSYISRWGFTSFTSAEMSVPSKNLLPGTRGQYSCWR